MRYDELIELIMESYEPVPETGCYLWTRAWNPNKYGKLTSKLRGGVVQELAHRIVYKIVHGPIPEGMVVCHKCDTPPCVNPDHLYAATQSENIQTAFRKGRKGKLSPEDKKFILASSQSAKYLAELFSVSNEAIHYIRRQARGIST